MAKLPVRFKRTALAFDEVAKFRPCESSGSEHSPENSLTDLSDLVNSFLEEDGREDSPQDRKNHSKDKILSRGNESDESWSDSDTKEELQSLFSDEDGAKRKIRQEVEQALRVVGKTYSKRWLMSRLRERGLDAGLCKSKWEKTGRIPAGDFEYIDVNFRGTRYVIEVFLAGEFDIARPTSYYTSLLETFPPIFVGKMEELKQIVRKMCAAIKVSMKSNEMMVAPWRRNGYMQVKWFGSYRRTVNAISSSKKDDDRTSIGGGGGGGSSEKKLVGFDASIPISYYCRDQSVRKGGLTSKGGYLAAAFAASLQ